MRFTSRQDFPETLPETNTRYCWYCGVAGPEKVGKDPVEFRCGACGRTAARVLVYDPAMQAYFDEEDRMVHESCGVIIAHKTDGKLLMFKRTKFPYLLTIPAGHLDAGEEPLPAAVRETEEEIGVAPKDLIKLFEGNIEGDSCLGGADIHHWNTYGCVVDSDVAVQLDDEGSSWGWYDIKDLSDENTVQPVMYMLDRTEVIKKLEGLIRDGS